MLIDFAQCSPNQIYHTLVQTIVPRPVAWVLTENRDKSFNLAPFSYFNAVSSDPPLIMLSIGKKSSGEPKDTRVNISERSHFVVHIGTSQQAASITESSRTLAYGESELTHLAMPLTDFAPSALPRLADCPVAMACECYRIEEITDKQALILGEVKALYISDQVAHQEESGRITVSAERLDPIARLGGDEYTTLGNIISVPRPA